MATKQLVSSTSPRRAWDIRELFRFAWSVGKERGRVAFVVAAADVKRFKYGDIVIWATIGSSTPLMLTWVCGRAAWLLGAIAATSAIILVAMVCRLDAGTPEAIWGRSMPVKAIRMTHSRTASTSSGTTIGSNCATPTPPLDICSLHTSTLLHPRKQTVNCEALPGSPSRDLGKSAKRRTWTAGCSTNSRASAESHLSPTAGLEVKSPSERASCPSLTTPLSDPAMSVPQQPVTFGSFPTSWEVLKTVTPKCTGDSTFSAMSEHAAAEIMGGSSREQRNTGLRSRIAHAARTVVRTVQMGKDPEPARACKADALHTSAHRLTGRPRQVVI